MLSSPIYIPEYVGNMALGHGSLVADDSGAFPANSFLLIVGDPSGCNVPQGSCNVDLAFPELFFDGRHVASALQINHVMGTTVGPASYFLNFTLYGMQVNAGHEVMMSRCWLGETNYDYPFSPSDLPTAVAIQLNGNDHFISETIVFSSKVGIEVNGAANNILNCHVWFPDNQALAFVDQGVMAFHNTGSQNRFSGCYIDGSRAVLSGAGSVDTIWTNGFECCAGVAGVPHGILLLGNTVGPGLIIQNNIFEGGNIFSIPTDNETAVTVSATVVAQNIFGAMNPGATRAMKTLSQTAATQWFFNFCDVLIFPTIVRASVISVVSEEGNFPIAATRTPNNCTVLVETSVAMTGQVTVEVDSSTLTNRLV